MGRIHSAITTAVSRYVIPSPLNWNDDDVERVAQLRAANCTTEEIAMLTGQPISRVAGMCWRRKIRASNLQRGWSNDEEKKLTDLRGKGMAWADIASVLGDRTAVAAKRRHARLLA